MWIVSSPDLKFTSSVNLSMIKFEFGKSPIHLQAAAGQLLRLILSMWRPGGRKYNPSCSPPSSAQHLYQRVGSVERRRLPLVAAVQWRIVSLSNQRRVLDLPFSPSLQTLSRLYDASYATNAEENALRSEWIGETYAVRLVSPPLHCFIGREWGRMKKAASHDCGTIQN